MNPVVLFLIVAGIVAVAMVMRSSGEKREGEDAAPEEGSGASVLDAVDDESEGGMVEAAAITSDGWAFVPRGHGVELVPPGEDDDTLIHHAQRHGSSAIESAASKAPVNPHTGRRLVFWKPGETLDVGDLIAARVVRGAPDFDPWRLEALGRDYDYRAFAFETQEAAQIGLALVSERIVRPPVDEHGDPIPVGAEDFAVAKRKFDETAEAVAMESDEEPNY